MKVKSFIAITLAVTVTAGLWLWFHRQTPQKPVSPSAEPAITFSSPKFVPANAPKMTTVMVKPAGVQALSPSASGWTAVQKIVDAYASYQERLHAISLLSTRPLTDSDWTLLQPFLLKPDGLDRDQLGQVIKNELLDVLCAMNPPPAGLGDVLAKMYQNPQQDEVIRDYAVQHLAAYYEQMTMQPDNTKTEQAIQNAKDVLWDALNETSDSIGGTALLALKRLSQDYTGFDGQGKIAAAALQMAGDNNAGELTHITAFQVCAQLGTTNALPVVLSAAQDGQTISVKTSAIGALGLLGGQEQIPFLNSVLQGNEERLKPAAQHALDKINARQTQVAILK
jgi:hypothetical protein